MAFASDKGRQGAAGVSTGFDIDNSLRFNDDDSAYLSRTPSSAGNRKTWTFSCWVKRGNLGISTRIINTTDPYEDMIQFTSGDKLIIYSGESAGYTSLTTTQVFRDTSAWYHIVFAVDTTQATASNRAKLYVNGSQVTAFDTETYASLNMNSEFNDATLHVIGYYTDSSVQYMDGYLAEVHFIDGTALDHTSFGETGDYGEWKAKKVSGLTYGTNGFHLDFKTSGTLGNDANGSNNWTTNNLASTDQMVDTPTNNFATWNSAINPGSSYFQEGNTLASGTGDFGASSTFAQSSGKWYMEMYVIKTVDANDIVIIDAESFHYNYTSDGYGSSDYHVRYYGAGSGYIESNGTTTQSGVTPWDNGEILGIALDLDSSTVQFYLNGSAEGTAETLNSNASGTWAIHAGGNASTSIICNFGQDSSFAGNKTAQGNQDGEGIGDFYYTPPSGFLALCTKNLPDVAVIPSEHFNTVTYTGDGNSTHAITGVGFQPDFLWVKCRSSGEVHSLQDAVRTADAVLQSQTTEGENPTRAYINSFDTDGFTTGNASGASKNPSNGNTLTYVAWNWKANGVGVSNTSGTITSTVSANADAGFSIVKWDGNGSVSAQTVGHGLSSTPEMIIRKRTDDDNYWYVYHKDLTSNYYEIYLNDTNAETAGGFFQNGMPNSTTFTAYDGGETYHKNITYCFHSVDGYSKVGSYTGNSSADGTFVYTGFRPAYVMVKDVTNEQSWWVFDSARDIDNPINKRLRPDRSTAEDTGDKLDFVSNGFKWRDGDNAWNYTGDTYIFIAFAESPFKHTNAR